MPESLGFPIPDRVAYRAATRCHKAQSGCWLSSYSTASHGYAQIGWSCGGRTYGTTAHRAAWVYYKGQIPAGMTVDHRPTCDKRCVNVKHLRLLTNYENGRRTSGRDWPLGECINGHSNEFLIVTDGGRRKRCSICNREQKQRYVRLHPDRVRESKRRSAKKCRAA